MNNHLIQKVASDAMLEKAYEYVCHARKDRHADDDIWHCRFHWSQDKVIIQQELLDGSYHFSPCRSIVVDGNRLGMWNAWDTIVQKAMSWVLLAHLKAEISSRCFHVKGHGGTKAAVQAAASGLCAKLGNICFISV